MNTDRKTDPASSDATLRERAASARAGLAEHSSETSLRRRFGNARGYADTFDFSPFDLIDVVRLYETTRQIGDYLSHTTNMPLCVHRHAGDHPVASPIGWFLDFEKERMAFFRDRCVAEIHRRQPQSEDERDEALVARLAHEMDCNGRIAEPGLLLEALKAWG
ncbi:hypothetical protein [Methylobacterium sp. J-090]|uniref:hypothetical protein n=1 Tax=Methylobacterium sp. J-090 TaxID=2836666 RepID=UPI001FB9BD17|nr:hypothetical protein [Methylobacterium sp. J-090]MCJ2081208.1 hypothetical protein [Methylobacterium sp. J-090]